MRIKNNKGAMEMSVGTIVTIVLLMTVLVLGIFLIQKVFRTGTGAVDAIDSQVNAEINKLFSEEDARLIIFPNSGVVDVSRGGDKPSGFAFAVKNEFQEPMDFTYEILAIDGSGYDYQSRCGSTMSEERAQGFIDIPSGKVRTTANGKSSTQKAFFITPEDMPKCMIPYEIVVYYDDMYGEPEFYDGIRMRVNFV